MWPQQASSTFKRNDPKISKLTQFGTQKNWEQLASMIKF